MSWSERVPEPATLWIRAVPKRWPAPERPAVDLATRRLRWPEPDATPGDLPPTPPVRRADPCYVPPVPRSLQAARERWVLDLERTGGTAVVHLTFEEAAEPAATGVRWIDGLALVLGQVAPEAIAELPLEIAVAFPLLPGLSPGPVSWQRWLEPLSAAGRRLVHPVAVELTPADRRRLVDLAGEAHWEGIFHGDVQGERAFAIAAAATGLETRVPRPGGPRTVRQGRNRDLATALAEAGHLMLRLARSEPEAQALLASARHLEATPLDVSALTREGNLPVLTWLSPLAREIVGEMVASGHSERLQALQAEWRTPDAPE